MKIETTKQALEVEHAIRTAIICGKARMEGPSQAAVEMGGGTTYTLTYASDAKWRLGSTSTWGNYSGVWGVGCDASGLVLTHPQMLDRLNQMRLTVLEQRVLGGMDGLLRAFDKGR